MRNTKEIEIILTAIHCLNFVGNNDKNIRSICDYAFGRIFNSNTNLITLACVGKTQEEILNEVNEMLFKETDYKSYLDWHKHLEEKRNEQTTKKTK